MTRQVKSRSTDPREMPAYTVPEAAHYLGLPVSTVRYWSAGRDSYKALITAAEKHPVILSFLNLVELHLLAAIRREHEVSMPNVRRAIDYLKKSYRHEPPAACQGAGNGRPGYFHSSLRPIDQYLQGWPDGHAARHGSGAKTDRT